MACLHYATFLLLLILPKDASATGAATGDTCTTTDGCINSTVAVCVPTVLKCLLKPSISCNVTDNKCVTGATCSGTTPTCSCDATKHAPATPSDYCKLKVDQQCSATTEPCLDNGECTAQTCKCKTGYTANIDKTACSIQANSYGATCIPPAVGLNDTCTAYDVNSECPAGAICTCKTNYHGVVGSKCGLAVDAPCNASSVCLPNAECSGASCKCKTGYMANGAKTACNVTENTYGGACTLTSSTDSCVTIDSNAVCNTLTSKCECKQGFIGSIGGKCSGAMGLASSLIVLLAAFLVKTCLA